MRAVVQRVKRAKVISDGETTGEIQQGLFVLLGVGSDDDVEKSSSLARKIVHLRIFSDEQGKMGKSVKDVGGGILIVSQFTLYASTDKGHRPSFSDSAPAELAEKLYDHIDDNTCDQLR